MEATILLLCLLTLSATSLAGGQGIGHEEHYDPSPYHYEYKVHDEKEYLDFGAEEEGDGKGDVHGYYHVQLPDGRLQKVTYKVNDYSGYIAEVTYDGHAQHPSYHGSSGRGGGQRYGKALVQNPIQPSVHFGSDRSGKSLIEKTRGQSFSGDFFGSSSRISASAPPTSSNKKTRVIEPSALPAAPEPREARISESIKQKIVEEKDKFVSKPFSFEHKPIKRVNKKFDKHEFQGSKVKPFTTFAKAEKRTLVSKARLDAHKDKKEEASTFLTGSRFGGVRQSPRTGSAKSFSFEKESSKAVSIDVHGEQDSKVGPFKPTTDFKTSIPLRQQSSERKKQTTTEIQSNRSIKTPTSSEFKGFSSDKFPSHPVRSSIDALRKGSKPHKKLRHKSSLIVHRPLPPQ